MLLYGHYDVQPVDPIELWKSPPFEPEVRDGNLYARGAVDDKGQMLALVKALESLMRADGTLPVNIKILFEGEEEAGGESIEKYVREHPEELACDAVLVADTGMPAPGVPAIIYSLRGILYTEIVAEGRQTRPALRRLRRRRAQSAARARARPRRTQRRRWQDQDSRSLSQGEAHLRGGAGALGAQSGGRVGATHEGDGHQLAARRAGLSAAGAHLGAPDAGGTWLRRRLHRRGREDRYPCRGQGQGQPAPAAGDQASRGARAAQEACRGALP